MLGPERQLSYFYLNKFPINKEETELASAEKKALLKNFLPTIRFMDHRRLKRQLQGVRKTLPYYRVMIFTLFCLFLIIYPYLYVVNNGENISLGLKFSSRRGDVILTVFLAILIITGLVIVARLQSTLSLQWAMYTCYIFIIVTISILLFTGFKTSTSLGMSTSIILLYSFGLTQVVVHLAVRIVIYLGPKLALSGKWFSWAENFKVIEKQKDSVTFSRYNDITGLFGNNIFCICFCCYRVSYRCTRGIIHFFRKMITKKSKNKRHSQPPFSHQIRYKGPFDQEGRPHGFGEWLEDHPFGERLQGFWWHGFPFATYEAQEVGSGSIFNSTLVGFFACNKKYEVKRAVAACEISVSGHFFTDFPNTIYVNPSSIDVSIKDNIQLYHSLVKRKIEMVDSAESLSWCFAMLNWQASNPFFNAFDDSSIRVHLDRNTSSLSIDGYRHIGNSNFVRNMTLAVEKVKNRKTRKSNKEDIYTPKLVLQPVIPQITIKKPKETTNIDTENATPIPYEFNEQTHPNEIDEIDPSKYTGVETTGNNEKKPDHINLKIPQPTENKDTTSHFSLRSLRTLSLRNISSNDRRKNSSITGGLTSRETFVGNIFKDTKRKIEEALEEEEDDEPPVSSLFQEQDEWRSQQDKYIKKVARISIQNWKKINAAIGFTPPEEILLFIPGYNVNIAQGCAQLSHLVSFSKLPGHIQPFMFHWGGAMGGIFSPLLYPWSKKRAEGENVGELFVQFITELKTKKVRRVHLLSHSAGARAFMNGMRHCRGKGLFMEHKAIKGELANSHSNFSQEDSEQILIKSIILINPDYGLNNFISDDFYHLRDICNNFTLYGDTRDQILGFSEKWNRERCLGNHIFKLYLPNEHFDQEHQLHPSESHIASNTSMIKNDHNKNKSYIFHENEENINNSESLAKVVHDKTSHMISTSSESPDFLLSPNGQYNINPSFNNKPDDAPTKHQTIDNNFNDTIIQAMNKPTENQPQDYIYPTSDGNANTFPFLSPVGNAHIIRHQEWLAPRAQAVKWLNLDVIDTTFVETHTDFLKHCFYQVSREIVDDIREVITTGVRAQERISRLDKRRGNVFCFRVAPANVKSIYG